MKRVRDELPQACACCDIRMPVVRINGVWCCGPCLSIGAYRAILAERTLEVSK